MKNALMAAIAAAALATGAQASIIPVLLGGPTADGANYQYSYMITLSGDEGLHNGSFLNIVDFAGFVPGSIMVHLGIPPDFVLTTPGTGPGSIFPGFTDDPTIPDLVLTYDGPTMNPSGVPLIEDFTVDSTFGSFGMGSYSAQATKFVFGNPVAQTDANQGPVEVPTGSVPEPATWALMLSGFGMAGGALRSRSRTKAAV